MSAQHLPPPPSPRRTTSAAIALLLLLPFSSTTSTATISGAIAAPTADASCDIAAIVDCIDQCEEWDSSNQVLRLGVP